MTKHEKSARASWGDKVPRQTDRNPFGAPSPAPGGSLSATRIRRATVEDARAIATIGVKGWQAAYRGILTDRFLAGLSVASREVAWNSLLQGDEEGAAPAWVAKRDGVVIGFLASGPPRDEDVPLPGAEVYAIYVLPESWRGGAGRALLTTAVDHWRGRGVKALVLWVLEENARGRAFYDAMDWRPDGASQPLDIGGFVVTEIRYGRRVGNP